MKTIIMLSAMLYAGDAYASQECNLMSDVENNVCAITFTKLILGTKKVEAKTQLAEFVCGSARKTIKNDCAAGRAQISRPNDCDEIASLMQLHIAKGCAYAASFDKLEQLRGRSRSFKLPRAEREELCGAAGNDSYQVAANLCRERSSR